MLSKFIEFLRILSLGKQPEYSMGRARALFLARKGPLGFPQLTVEGGSAVQLSRGPSREKPRAARDVKQKRKGYYVAVKIPKCPACDSPATCRAPEYEPVGHYINSTV